MNDSEIMTVILLIGLVIGLFASFLIKNVKYHWANLVKIHENNTKFQQLQKNVDEMRAKGDLHEWVDVMTPQGKLLTCRKTGWTPSLKGFLPLQMIESHLEQVKAEEEYKQFRSARIQLIAHERQMTIAEVERLVEQIFSMKKDFYLLRLSRLQQEMTSKAAAVTNEQGKD